MYASIVTVLKRIILALRIPAFRWLWGATCFIAMGMTASSLALGWLVLELTDSPFWVGAVAAFRGVAQVLFGVFAGVLLDRFDKKRVLLLTLFINAALPAILGVLVFTGAIELWHLLLGSSIDGFITSMRAPAINTLTYQLVGPKRILNANAAKSLGFNLAGIVGSVLTGSLVELRGEAIGLYLAAGLNLAAVVLILFVRGDFRPILTDKEPVLLAARKGLGYAWRTIELRRLLSLSVIMETFGFSFLIMLPVVARDVLGLGADGLGILSAIRSTGAAISNLGVASLGDYERKSRLLVGTAAIAGVALVLFGLLPWYAASVILVFVYGAAMTAYDVTMNSLTLTFAESDWRGRVQSIYTLTYGFVSLGGFVAGIIATAAGAPIALVVSGGVIVAYMGGTAKRLLALDEIGNAGLNSAD